MPAVVTTTLISGLAAAASAAAGHHVETAPDICCGWGPDPTTVGTAEDSPADVSFAIHAKETGRDAVARVALAVSDPASPSYGEYLSTAALEAMTAPDPADLRAIRDWIDREAGPDARVEVHRGRRVVVTLPRGDAERLLRTKFETLVNAHTGQRKVRAGDYTLPAEVHAAASAVYGLHGLPLPPRKKASQAPPAKPAEVTPAVILSQYNVGGVTPAAGSKNKQAVAEFQGQTMNSTDLQQFFAAYVPNAPSGADTVSKFVGDPGDKMGQTEASLDIQYIMGVAPGVATEFWLYNPSDFCADLKNWTSTLLADDDPPLVTSVSYGWQGNLTRIGCKDAEVDGVDADFAKLAAKGITIVFASGDSGSGYSPQYSCDDLDANTTLVGHVMRSFDALRVTECCEEGRQAAGYTFDGPATPPSPYPGKCAAPEKEDTGFQGEISQKDIRVPDISTCCQFSKDFGAGFTFVPTNNGGNMHAGKCTIFKSISGTTSQPGATSGQNAPLQRYKCTLFSEVTGKKPSDGSVSGGTSAAKVQLWPSWPASSPWVTAVGATRFVGQKAGNAEMATDQFGSGGGFSAQFGQSPNAKWQSDDVAGYLNIVPQGAPLPPASAFPAKGRATPDVAALGEGFQVLQAGRVMAVGGTSASAPTFAGIVSLLNEHQLQNGKKPLGFLNPWLYANADAFTDVTLGTNAIGRGTGPIKYGFNCTKGWDPATGLGTPLFKKLVGALP